MKFEIITSLDEFITLRPEIEANLKGVADSFFYSPSWLIPFQRILADDRSVMHIIGRDDDGVLNGSIHLSLVQTPFLKVFRPQVMALLGTRSVVSPEHLEFAIQREARKEWFNYLERFFEEQLKWSAFAVFDSVAETAENASACMDYLGSRGFRVTREVQDVCPYFDLPESFDELLGAYSANMRRIIRRTLRRCRGKVGMVDYREVGDIGSVLQEARRLHGLSRAEKGDIGSFERDGYIEFHRELVDTIREKDCIYVKFLTAGKTPIAFRYGFIVDNVYYDYQTGYDPHYSEWRPGFVLLAMIVPDLIGRGVKRFDFLRGDEPYKRHWAPNDRKTYRYYVFPTGLKADIYSTIWRLYHGIK